MNPLINPPPPEAAEPQGLLLTESQVVKAIWPTATPSVRWFRDVQSEGGVPVVRVRGKRFFDAAAVKSALIAKYQMVPAAK